MLNALYHRRESGALEHSSSVQKHQKTTKLLNDEEEDDDTIQFQELPEELCCPIHLGYLKKAVVSKCGHSFCKDCIHRTLENKAQCPIDRKPLEKSDLFPNLIIANLIDELLMFCKNQGSVTTSSTNAKNHNTTSSGSSSSGINSSTKSLKNDDSAPVSSSPKEILSQDSNSNSGSTSQSESGCTQVFKFKNRQAHYRECEHSIVNCDWCSTHTCKRKELSQHKLTCSARPVSCNLCSKPDIPHCDLKRHTKWFCPQSTIVCKKCQAKHLRQASKEHMQDHCPYSEMICAALDKHSNEFCGVKYLRKDFEEHRKVCQFVPAKCTNTGCHVIVARRRAAKHDQQCAMKVVTCPNKECALEFPRKSLAAHRAVCKLEMLQCAFFQAGCKGKIARFQVEEHMRDRASEHMLLLCGSLSAVKQENTKLRKLVQNQQTTFKRKLRQMRGINKRVHRIENTLEELAGTPLDPFAHQYDDGDFSSGEDEQIGNDDVEPYRDNDGDDDDDDVSEAHNYCDIMLAEVNNNGNECESPEQQRHSKNNNNSSSSSSSSENNNKSRYCSLSSLSKAAHHGGDVKDPQFLELVAWEQKKTSTDVDHYYAHILERSTTDNTTDMDTGMSGLVEEYESWEARLLDHHVTSLHSNNHSRTPYSNNNNNNNSNLFHARSSANYQQHQRRSSNTRRGR